MTVNHSANVKHSPVIVFDGLCNLCSGVVRFVVRWDRCGLFKFVPLQSSVGQRLMRESGLNEQEVDSILLIKDASGYIKSNAALEIAANLPFPWPLLGAFRCLPQKFRDHVYDFIARYRYRWFGKKAACTIPSAAIKNRFMG